MSVKFLSELENVRSKLEEKLDMLLPEADYGMEARLFEAMRYSVLSSGKRLRPFLTVTTSKLFGISEDSAYQAAAAIELIHAYSLIHDDLPAMDNDDFRRGQPSCHKKFDEATAILAGDSLLTLAFEILADNITHPDPSVRTELISSVAKAVGGKGGMCGGQMMDLVCHKDQLTINEITRLQRMKTGTLFAVSCEAGAILGKASKNLRVGLRGFAHAIGLAFQITDDILDYESHIPDIKNSSAIRIDKSKDKATFISALGVEKAKEQAAMLARQAIDHLDAFDNRAEMLISFANFILNRSE